MAETLKREETAPNYYPDPPSGLSAEAAMLDFAPLWAQVETYIAWRWEPRAVTWFVDGSGLWEPDLAPCELTSAALWDGSVWVDMFPAASPLGGYDLAADGVYRITGTVGANVDTPEDVNEALRRLAEYLAQADAMPRGATRHEVKIAELTEATQRPAAWMARALDLSGASDLLRKYRRV